MMIGGQKDGQGVKTTIFMGGTSGNSSDEEILQGMRGRFGEGDLEIGSGLESEIGNGRMSKLYDHTKSIHKTTQIDVSYQ